LNYRKRDELKPFHVISKPFKSQLNIEDRLFFANWLSDWSSEDFLHLAPSDEFFVYSVREPNHQNDRIWAKSIEDINEDQRYRELIKNPVCIGIFVLFTVKKLMFIIKENGQSWDGNYFRNTILRENVILFLSDAQNVLDSRKVIFLHDKTPCMRAIATQQLPDESGLNLWGNDFWAGNSPDLNPAEHIGSIIKDEVETRMLRENQQNRYSYNVLLNILREVLVSIENNSELFVNLLLSYPDSLIDLKL
jgi:hypothetical protein